MNTWLSLRQIIVNTEPLRIQISKLAKNLDTGIHTHLCEGAYGVDFTVENYQLRPPEYFEKIGILNDRLHCAHSVLLTPEEVDLYAKYDISAAHCAFNNYNLAPHRFYDMVRKNIRVGLGTDGPGSRGTLDLFQVSHYAVLGQTISYGMPFHAGAPVGYPEMLRFGIRNGARAARLTNKTGVLKAGQLADIVLVSRDDYDQYPSTDPTVTLGQNTVGANVRTVIVDGRIVMKDRHFLRWISRSCVPVWNNRIRSSWNDLTRPLRDLSCIGRYCRRSASARCSVAGSRISARPSDVCGKCSRSASRGRAGGIILVVLGLIPKLAAAVAAIPNPVLGGAGLVMFGMVAATGIRILGTLDFHRNGKNLFIVASALGFGMIPTLSPNLFQHLPPWTSPITSSSVILGTLVALILNLVFNGFRQSTF